jgi:carbonic anhydrase/acetyltransferase-like protein (isoleucine patch superfamily)
VCLMALFEHRGKRPQIDPSAWIAPTATIVGDVTIGAESTVAFGAVVTAESGPVTLGRQCVVMENAVLRGVSGYPLVIDDNVLVGPHAHLSGCHVEREVFVATGASIFNGAVLGAGSVVRINGVVHVRTSLAAGAIVPIGWVAVGDPAEILPPEKSDRQSALLLERDFSGTVFGLEKRSVAEMTQRYSASLRRYREIRPVDSTTDDP